MSQIAIYGGWYDQNISGPFTRPHVEFMPGAFAYHLHSFSAVNLRSATEGWAGPLLAKGATITMGCVKEPYLTFTPQVAVFVARLIYDRMSFGEAAYAALPALSWQITIVGDPLYRPFNKPPQQLHEELQLRRSRWLEWSHLRLIDLSLARGTSPRGAQAYLENLGLTRRSAVLSEKLADLCESLGQPSSAIDTYEQALKLDPSPLQRLRLRLRLGEKLGEMHLDQKAYDDYASLLQEDPDYPNKLDIYRKLLALAQNLGKKEDADRYEELIRVLTLPPPAPAPNHK
jgi:tetratricopeptide (TPR) repeat protein